MKIEQNREKSKSKQQKHLMEFRRCFVLDLSVDRAVHHFSFTLVNTDLGYMKVNLYVDLCRAANRYYLICVDTI